MLALDSQQPGPQSPHPFADIGNSEIKARLWLPDSERGFYRGTRFDWSGSMANLTYASHTYFGQWFVKFDPAVHDVAYVRELNGYAAGKASADVGPVEEFTGPGDSALGFEEAQPGGTFLKIGVGMLRKPLEGKNGTYDRYFNYEIADSGQWSVHKSQDEVEFTQKLASAIGFGYVYTKTVRLSPASPDLFIEHVLKNTGSKTLESSVYNHNFLINDHQPPGPPLRIVFPFEIKPERLMTGLAEASGHEIRYIKTLSGNEVAATRISGFTNTAKDYDFRVENPATASAVRITSDHPMQRFALWSTSSVIAPEPFTEVHVEPGKEFRWAIRYHFSTVNPPVTNLKKK
jgi:hypothetical protein